VQIIAISARSPMQFAASLRVSRKALRRSKRPQAVIRMSYINKKKAETPSILVASEMDVLLLVICNSVKMGIRLCYKWEKPE
jgi:hypothetical protein